MAFVISTFYKFASIQDTQALRFEIYRFCKTNSILGTIIIAPEGINGTISGSADSIKLFQQFFVQLDDGIFCDIEFKDSFCKFQPLKRLKLKLKSETIKIATPVDIQNTGEYLDAAQWDQKLSNPNTLVIDTRNDYEIEHGTFENAINPNTENFSELPNWLDKTLSAADKENKEILMFCTGGVRCEKSTAYLKDRGFKKVYHLKGGIIKYLEDTKNQPNKWRGNCFVFDDRVVLDKNLEPVK